MSTQNTQICKINSIFLHLFITVAYLNLGTSLIALGRCHEAASVLRDGSTLDGTGLRDRTSHESARISSLLQLGGLYADQGKLQRAIAVYKEALHTLPNNYPPQVSFKMSIFTRSVILHIIRYKIECPSINKWWLYPCSNFEHVSSVIVMKDERGWNM